MAGRRGPSGHTAAAYCTQNDFLIGRMANKFIFTVFWRKIRISLKICTPLRLVVRLTNFGDFREKSKIWPKIWAKNRFFGLFLPQNSIYPEGSNLAPHAGRYSFWWTITLYGYIYPHNDGSIVLNSWKVRFFNFSTWKFGNSTPLTRLGLFLGILQPQSSFTYPQNFSSLPLLLFLLLEIAQIHFWSPEKSHFHVFWRKIRISLKICTPLRLVVRLTNFRDFREKSKIWPNISAKNRFFGLFLQRVYKGSIRGL